MSVPEPTKAVIQNLDTGDKITVAYNPTEYSYSRKMELGEDGEVVQFQTLTEPDFTVSLFFDSYEKGTDVRLLTQPIADLQNPTQGAQAKRDPPKCLFSWGGFKYTGVLSNFEQRFTLFLPTGIAVRCECNLTFTDVPTEQEVLEDAGLDNCRRFAVVNSSDRLDNLAWRETGDPANWRGIAAANGIEDPLLFPLRSDLGRTLIIPDYHG